MTVQTVYLSNMTDVGGYKTDVVHNDRTDSSVNISAIPYLSVDGVTNFSFINVECQACHTISQYPLAGGLLAQRLHYLKMMTLSLGDVVALASARSLPTTGTQSALAISIVKDECAKQNVPYYE